MPKKQNKAKIGDPLAALRKIMGVSDDDPLITRADQYVAITDVITTGSKELDMMLTPGYFDEKGKGGVPRGFVCEFFGPHGGGKSSLCYRLAADVTKKKEQVIWFDVESSFYPEWAMNFGVDPKYVIHVDSGKTGEQYLHAIKEGAASGAYSLIVIDSVTGLRPKKLIEQDLEKEQRVGASASLMSRVLPDVVPAAKKGNCTVVFVNQVRRAFGPGFSYETTPHGEALRFYSSLRLRVSSLGSNKGRRSIMSKGEEIGIRSKVMIQKSRFGPPFKECIVPIYFKGMCADPLEVVLDLAMAEKLVRCKTKKVEDGEDQETFIYKKETYEDIDDLKHVLITEEDEMAELVTILAAKHDIPAEYAHLLVPKADGAKKEEKEEEPEEETKQAEA